MPSESNDFLLKFENLHVENGNSAHEYLSISEILPADKIDFSLHALFFSNKKIRNQILQYYGKKISSALSDV